MLVVSDYNQILMQLEPDERQLFGEHIRRLDRRVNAGMNRFTWASKSVIEWYVTDCRKHCTNTRRLVLQFKKGRTRIREICKQIGRTSLIDIQRNYIYEDLEKKANDEYIDVAAGILRPC